MTADAYTVWVIRQDYQAGLVQRDPSLTLTPATFRAAAAELDDRTVLRDYLVMRQTIREAHPDILVWDYVNTDAAIEAVIARLADA